MRVFKKLVRWIAKFLLLSSLVVVSIGSPTLIYIAIVAFFALLAKHLDKDDPPE